MRKRSKETSPFSAQSTKTMEQYKADFLRLFDVSDIPRIHALIFKRMKFLESIYIRGEENYGFSETFSNAAVKEREDLCQQSGACYSILQDNGITASEVPHV